MYVSPISSRFWFGRFTPAMRAIPLLALTLLVARIRADDHGRAVPLDDAAPLAHGLDGCSDLHAYKTAPGKRGERVSSAHRKRPAAPRHRSKGTALAVRIRGPASVTATVCSKWAASEPSRVEIVHPSSWTWTSGRPAVIIGSIASVMPSLSTGPRPGRPKFGICGSSWYESPTPWPTRLRTMPKPASSLTCWT